MLKYKWHSTHITTNKEANDMIALFNKIKPKYGAFDTETDGLNIIINKPFLFQFGFINEETKEGWTFSVDIEKQPELSKAVIKKWHELAKTLDIYFGHNVKFDLHMLTNIELPYTKNNISDTMFYIRHAHDALTPANGGPPLGLKEYTSKYILTDAKYHEKILRVEKTQVAKELNNKLKKRLGTTLKVLEELFSDPIMDIEDLPDDIKTEYIAWVQEDLPLSIQNQVTSLVESDFIPYNKLNRANIIKYAQYDIIFTLEIFLHTRDAIKARDTFEGINIENNLIYPLVRMERQGFNINKAYLEKSKIRLKAYIKERREHLHSLVDKKFTIGQHEVIKQLLIEKFHIPALSTGSEVLEQIVINLKINNKNPEAVDFIETIEELRTLEKWYSAYIIRFLKDLKYSNKIYPTINSVGTVSGRCTSDWQQMPKDTILDKEGNELYSPRKIVLGPLVSIDFSQVELRVQAMYTILVGHPDKNLCRAYMPYNCFRYIPYVHKDSISDPLFTEYFNPFNPEHIKSWNEKDSNGNSSWHREEDYEPWTPVDVHGATAKEAFGIDETHPDFKKLRYIGKRVNFAKNYGAQYNKIRSMFPDKTPEECRRIDEAYYKAFPGVKYYHDYCYIRGDNYSNTQNLYGIKYYGLNGHKLINTLVQGSAAYYLKEKIKLLDTFILEHNLKTKMIFQIHDELLFQVAEDEIEYVYAFKEIMENANDWCVPIVAEIDMAKTNWGEKQSIHSLDELKEVVVCNTTG